MNDTKLDEIVTILRSITLQNQSQNIYENKMVNGLKFENTKKQKKKSNKVIFTNIARIIPYKGHLYLLRIVKKLIKFNSKFIFYIIGDTYPGYENTKSHSNSM